jgi:hypothetical protein
MLMPEMSPPDERGHPRKKFRKIKGFRDIIVGAALESADAVLELMPSSEKESGSRNAAFTQMGQDVEAVAPGEHHVEHDTVIVVAERTVQRFITRCRLLNRVPLLPERLVQKTPKIPVVLDQ